MKKSFQWMGTAVLALATLATTTAQAQRAVKVMHTSRTKANGAIHSKLKNKVLSLMSLSSSSTSSSVNPDKSMLAPFGVYFAQVAKDQLVLTVDETGLYHPFFYINDYLGYADPVTGDLLYCSDYKPRDQFITLQATDCQIDGSIWDISKYDTYSNGKYILSSDGSTLYYDNGSVAKDYSGNWYYSDGVTKVYDNYYKNLYYSNSTKAYDAYYKDFYHPSGAKLLDGYYHEMKFSTGNLFVDADAGYAYYQNGADLRRYYLDTNNKYTTYMKYPNQSSLANFKSDGRADIYYSLGYTLKHDVNPYDGDIYYENGSSASSYVNYEYVLPFSYGYVDVDADHISDIVATTLTDGAAYFYVVSSRVKPVTPPMVSSFGSDSQALKSLSFSWTTGGGSTDSFLISIKTGNVSNASCVGGNSLTGSTRNYTWGSLTPDTAYTVAICAVNEIGQRSASSVVTVRTLPIVYPPKVSNLKTSKLLSNRIDAVWTSGGGNTSGYYYSIAKGNTASSCGSGSSSSYSSASFTGLTQKTHYTIGVCAYESNGYTSPLVTLGVDTPAVVVPPAVKSIKSASSLSSVSLKWSSGGGNTFDYVIARRKGYGDVNCTSPASLAAITTSSTPAVTLTKLTAGTKMTFAICARAEDGTLSAPITMRASTYTATSLPLPPAVASATGVRSGKNVVVNWASGGGTTAGYVWAYNLKGKASAVTCTQANAAKLGNVTSLTIKNAKQDKPYIIALCAVNEAGKLSPAVKLRVEVK